MSVIFNKLGKEYEYTLKTGEKRIVIVHGPGTDNKGFEISVDGVKGEYPDIKTAIGGAYQSAVECE